MSVSVQGGAMLGLRSQATSCVLVTLQGLVGKLTCHHSLCMHEWDDDGYDDPEEGVWPALTAG